MKAKAKARLPVPGHPIVFQHGSRTGKISILGNGNFKTSFIFAGQRKQNTFASFAAAHKYLQEEFPKLDADRVNSLSLTPPELRRADLRGARAPAATARPRRDH
jgi:hypothetical protein